MSCLLLVFRYSDSGHHADASLPILWRRKCFLVTCFSRLRPAYDALFCAP